MWMKTRSQWLCTEEAQAQPALHGRGTEFGDHWLAAGDGEREAGETQLLGESKEEYRKQETSAGGGCGQDISRNVISGIDFETGPCSVLQLPPAAPRPSGNACCTQQPCAGAAS